MEHYRSLNTYLRERFGEKVYKLTLDGGFSCPTRDGRLDTRGCIFCLDGSGNFAVPVGHDIPAAITHAKTLVAAKGGKQYIAYYQSYTGTYAPMERLRHLYSETIAQPDIVALDIATRPDCLPEKVISLLREMNEIKPVWIELGLQTVHAVTADYIRRGYTLDVYEEAVQRLHCAGIEVITHMILGLPGETAKMMRQTAAYIGRSGVEGIKFQLLHVLKGTELATDYEAGKFKALSLEEYICVLEECIESIPPEMVVHRLTGDGAKKNLIAPLWSADKKTVINAISHAFERDSIMQGRHYT
ncbi:MAG: TIGR01212 family radical SAM protein [Oscillospiraceae bacterium]|nr:TIGR01212 family radical SAM protein [Oscillospiraceae bacterium]